jgi:hypothetical protein
MNIYLYINSKQQGPYDTNQIMEALGNGAITYQTLCWQEGWKEWKPLNQIYPEPKSNKEGRGTPEFILEKQKYKTIWRRLWASLIDDSPVIILGFLQPIGKTYPAFLTLLIIFYYIRYIIGFQSKYGMTIGMWLLKLKVLKLDGSKITTNQAIIRSGILITYTAVTQICSYISANSISKEAYAAMSYTQKMTINVNVPILNNLSYILLILIYLSVLYVFLNKKRRCIWDLVAGTVIEKELIPRKPYAEVFI